jgi:hypothetical protein
MPDEFRHEALKKPLATQIIEVVGWNDENSLWSVLGRLGGSRYAGTGKDETQEYEKKM